MSTKEILRYVILAGIFLVPFLVLLVTDTLFFPYITGKNFAFRIIVEIIFSAWFLLALFDQQYRPRFSWIVISSLGLLGVMFLANLFGEFPSKSFWSNFERMDGYVTLVHFFLYFFVVGSVINSKSLWNNLFNTTLCVALALSIYAFSQISGVSQGNEWRVEGTLGNSTYMAVYMLFHIFIATLMVVRTNVHWLRYAYSASVLLFIFLLVQTGTRGAALGLVGGVLVTSLYIAFFDKAHPRIRRGVSVGLLVLLLLIGFFVTARDSAFVQDDPRLARLANISLEAGSTRFTIWSVAIEGVQERPLLGWGQGNFNYVFNTYFDPSLYGQESWFDRVHNIVLDWLIAGGVLGAVCYFGVIIGSLFYLVVRPLFYKEDATFSVFERGILLGLLVAYTIHNFFVFDNLVSYIFFGIILGYIHSCVSTNISFFERYRLQKETVEQIAVPVVGVATLLIVYIVNVPSMLAAHDIINALTETTVELRMEGFQKALSRGSFADQEIREQMSLQAVAILRSPDVSATLKQEVYTKTEQELQKQIIEKPRDARAHSFMATFYSSTGNLDKALEQLAIARSLSPQKSQIIFEQGFVYIRKNEADVALKYFKEAYELVPNNESARILYAIGALHAKDPDLVNSLIDTEARFERLAHNNLSVQAAYANGAFGLLEKILIFRISEQSGNIQFRIDLAAMLYETDRAVEAIGVLEQAIADIPSFSAEGLQFIEQIRSGKL